MKLYLNRAWNRIRFVFLQADTEFVELWIGLITGLWGAFLLLPWSTFSSHRAYWVMSQQMDELKWGLLLFGLGINQLICFFFLSFRWRKVSSFLLFSLWFYLAVLMAMSLPSESHSFIVGFVRAVCVAIAWCYVRLGILIFNGREQEWNLKV